ncbi:diguanylate cyclase (GGDEF)-like protein [Aneurinibacillus soli]|uniref:Phytochrome-like protein cph2 n=1 Tax=Aneurinibacillus soli TaxID=1500254 RepID=A0A0U5BMY0_9BACL|nr:EAL domain-containing protein [Aneurinibacillus soli]PYE59130.1 diguanylate cyclase (GGDEF)-like protein [Aneurinibacillus soli]BAU29550.1 Phytochrome-like protein cph2 [Aneurinibacillus soli]
MDKGRAVRIHQRNLLITKLIWGFWLLSSITAFGADASTVGILLPGGLVCGLIPFLLSRRPRYAVLTMYVTITLLFSLCTAVTAFHPALSTFIFFWLALVMSSLYMQIWPIVYAGTLTFGATCAFFFYDHSPIFRQLIPYDIISFCLLGICLTIFLMVHSWVSEGLREAAEHNRQEAIEAKSQMEKLMKRLQKSAERKMEHMALHDALTGLPNSRKYRNILKEVLARSTSSGRKTAVLLLDIDRFKIINDSLGHRFGDELIRAIAGRLKECMGTSQLVARQGGDEFMLLLENVTCAEIEEMADCLLQSVSKPFMLEGHELIVTPSVGISLYPDDGYTADTLIKNADTAMYRAKDQGKNTYCFYTGDMKETSARTMLLENSLRRAMENKELVLYYQPQICLRTGNLIGVEALLRWQHPQLGWVFPSEFIPIAEETGGIVPLGAWVLEEACSAARRWQREGYSPFRISVNLSARQFRDNRLLNTIQDILERSELDPVFLDLEITEGMAIHHLHDVVYTLEELKKVGVHISIDDFGTGYSSLSYLHTLPIHSIKIDKSFMRTNEEGLEADWAIVSAVITMAHELGLTVIAEGVETEEQRDILRAMGCDVIQGYLVARPLAMEEFETWLRGHQSRLLI